jgi:hypothetical protein
MPKTPAEPFILRPFHVRLKCEQAFRFISDWIAILKAMKIRWILVCCTFFLLAQGWPAALAVIQSARPIGIILSIDPALKRIAIKTDAGAEMNVLFDASTSFLQVSPGAKDLTNAAATSLSGLDVGDRILARGRSGGEPGAFVATSIIVMSKEDLAKKHAVEQAEWEKRGLGGVITALNPEAKEITIVTSSTAGSKPLVIAFAPRVVFRRYAPDSIKFSDARISGFEELKVGDQVKAMGTRNEDGTRFIAEQLVSGSFRSIAGIVVSSNPGSGTVQLTNLVTNKRLEVRLTSDSTVHRLSADLAQRLAMRIQGGPPPARFGGTPEENRSQPTGETGRAGESGQQRSNGDLQAAIEKLPRLKLEELKPGESVLLTCTTTADPSRVTAITLLAGIESLLRASSKGGRALDLGSWTVDLNMNAIVP